MKISLLAFQISFLCVSYHTINLISIFLVASFTQGNNHRTSRYKREACKAMDLLEGRASLVPGGAK